MPTSDNRTPLDVGNTPTRLRTTSSMSSLLTTSTSPPASSVGSISATSSGTSFYDTYVASNLYLEEVLGVLKSTEKDYEQAQVDELYKAMMKADPSTTLYARAVARLRSITRKGNLTPKGCYVTGTKFQNVRWMSTSGFSDVYQGKRKGKCFALKVLRTHQDGVEDGKKAALKESVIWISCRHANIVPFFGLSNHFPSRITLVSQWMPHGTVCSFLKKFPRWHRGQLIRGIIDGLLYLRSLGIVHGDIKGTNILIDGECRARIADFGLATLQHSSSAPPKSGRGGGTVPWMAPELFNEGPDEDPDWGKATRESDVYALGITLWELFSGGLLPYDRMKDVAVVLKVRKGHRPTRPDDEMKEFGFNDQIWELTQRCWDGSPDKRPDPADFLAVIDYGEPSVAEVKTQIANKQTPFDRSSQPASRRVKKLPNLRSPVRTRSTTGSLKTQAKTNLNATLLGSHILGEIIPTKKRPRTTSIASISVLGRKRSK